MADELVEAVAREIARVTLHDMEGSDPGPLSDERWVEMACDEDRVYLENIARAIIPLVREAERADVVAMPAFYQLRHHQQQADMDGVFVTVSRQALEEVLDAIERPGEHTQESQP